MSITVSVGLLSGKTVPVKVSLDERVATLKCQRRQHLESECGVC